jgi:hypothetical protein
LKYLRIPVDSGNGRNEGIWHLRFKMQQLFLQGLSLAREMTGFDFATHGPAVLPIATAIERREDEFF